MRVVASVSWLVMSPSLLRRTSDSARSGQGVGRRFELGSDGAEVLLGLRAGLYEFVLRVLLGCAQGEVLGLERGNLGARLAAELIELRLEFVGRSLLFLLLLCGAGCGCYGGQTG